MPCPASSFDDIFIGTSSDDQALIRKLLKYTDKFEYLLIRQIQIRQVFS
jgi:hypothetical protein